MSSILKLQLIVTLFFLVGCSNASNDNVSTAIDTHIDTIAEAIAKPIAFHNNNKFGTENDSIAKILKDSLFKKPNIIIIVADDLGYGDVGYLGSDIKTKNIDWLAENGVVFNRFYAHTSCSPSRIGLLTGRFPARTGLANGVITPESSDGIDPDLYLLPEMLADANYNNRACIGKWHLGHSSLKYHPLNHGFTYFYGHYGGMVDFFTHVHANQKDWHKNYEPSDDKGYTTDLITNDAITKIDEWSNKENPFFMYIAYNAPHVPLQAKDESLQLYGYDFRKAPFLNKGEKEINKNDIGRGNTKRQTYQAMVHSIDEGVGKIIDELKQKNIFEETLIVFYSDNGGDLQDGANNGVLRDGKGSFFEGGVRVPSVLYYPKLFDNKKEINQIASQIDLYPTIMEIVNADINNLVDTLDGHNLLNIISQNNTTNKRAIYLSKSALVTQKWKLNGKELFDLENDIEEKNNVAHLHPEIADTLKNTLAAMVKKIELPLKRKFDHVVNKNWEMNEYKATEISTEEKTEEQTEIKEEEVVKEYKKPKSYNYTVKKSWEKNE